MNTTITIKTDKKVHREAKKTAQKLGIPLTTLINAYLKNLIREQSFTVSVYPTPRPEKIAEWEQISDDMDKHPEKYKVYGSVEEYVAHLDTVWQKADRKRK